MKVFKGDPIAKGIAMGKMFFLHEPEENASSVKGGPDEEWQRFLKASEKAMDQLNGLYEKTAAELSEEEAAIFEVHMALMEDEDFTDAIRENIESGMEASAAVSEAGARFSEMFSQMDDEYMRERAVDIKDITIRLKNILNGIEDISVKEPSVIGAGELRPSQTMQMDRKMLLGFVTRYGASNSHTAILARNLGIPAVSGIDDVKDLDGAFVIIDGEEGKVISEPDEETIREYEERSAKIKAQKEELLKLKDEKTVTKSGRSIKLYANVDDIDDMELVKESGAEGVGLLRSEFLYLKSSDYPSEEELFKAYRKAAEEMAPKEVIIRTLDIGADKQIDYFNLEKEENPAMGLRAIRLCLKRPELFRTQLRAILRATAYGNISIMFPMIISTKEVDMIKDLLEDIKKELVSEGSEVGEFKTGIMVETPAAVIMSEELSEKVDFFSIGTNDLTQYTLAIDRQNKDLGDFFDAHHPAVLRSIETTVKNAHKNNCIVGICGELGSDITLTDFFLDIGVDELSVSPSKILELRKHIIASE